VSKASTGSKPVDVDNSTGCAFYFIRKRVPFEIEVGSANQPGQQFTQVSTKATDNARCAEVNVIVQIEMTNNSHTK